MPLHWTAGIHHDGSALYVSNPLPAFDETVTITLRTPQDAPITRVFIRTVPDGERHFDEMQKSHTDEVADYWTFDLKITMPLVNYCFKVMSPEGAYYYDGLGARREDSPDNTDFKLIADFAAPDWLDDAVFYQIFPERFANGDPSLTVKPGAWTRDGHSVQVREWGALPLPYKEAGNVDFFGGDLPGIQQKIDYLLDLGVNAIYLNPIFTSDCNHRYNIHDFYNVDPHLGGNDALVDLNNALHDNNMRVVLDMTPNHIGSLNPWFTDAQQDADAETAEYFTFYERPNKYLSWLGVDTLPKFNYRSQKLRDAMYNNPDSILQYWLKPPYNIDGWRLDVYNMTARQGRDQMLTEISIEMREALKAEHPNAYVFGEHYHDTVPHLQGDQMDGMMNYQGFNLPMWRWLVGWDLGTAWGAPFADDAPFPAESFVKQLADYRANVPWAIARQQFNQLCSHDTNRIMTIVAQDRNLVKLGITLLMTYPGVPCVYYGDEIGMEGGHDPDNRRCMPWDEADWDIDLREYYKRVIALRKSAPALTQGGYQHLFAEDSVWAFQRQSAEQRLIVIGHRGPDALASLTVPVAHAGIADGTQFTDLLSDATFTVTNGEITLSNLATGAVYVLEAP